MKLLRNENMGQSDLGWLRSRFHFSFADYYNPSNMNYGVLRVINDDLVKSGTGFDTHPHRDMEIITYVVNGELSHQDSMGHERRLTRGMVQYMSAGTGVMHSEYNHSHETARFLQLWIPPNKKGLTPNYGDHTFDWKARSGKWLHMVSPVGGDAPINIHQDADIYSLWLPKGDSLDAALKDDRQGYLVQIEGTSTISDQRQHGLLYMRDAAELDTTATLTAQEDSHYLLITMAKQ